MHWDGPADHAHGWEYFRTYVNPRWVREDFTEEEIKSKKCCSRGHKYRLADSTEQDEAIEIIPVLTSTTDDLGLFGIGVGLYYKQILSFFWLSLIYGFILFPLSRYYASPLYNIPHASEMTVFNNSLVNTTLSPIPLLLKGSAICSDYSAVAVDGGFGLHASYCKLRGQYGIYDFVAMIIIFIFCIWTARQQKSQVEKIDLAQQTPQDYSLVVNDPDPDADNPDEWKEFFKKYGTVAYVTVTRANGKLLNALAVRRSIKHNIFLESFGKNKGKDKSSSINSSKAESAKLLSDAKPGLCASKLQKLEYQLAKQNVKIAELAKQHYPVCKVFVTFNDEKGQRNALQSLTTGAIPAFFEYGRKEEDKFRGTNVLSVAESVEPSEVIWQNLEMSALFQTVQGIIASILTLGIVVACYFMIVTIKDDPRYARLTGVGVSLINSILPVLLKLITVNELHVDEGDKQDSLFMKLTTARFMNTAIINYLTTPFNSFLSQNTLKVIQSILVADAIITPTISFLDLGGTFKRTILARFAENRPKLISYFTGTDWYLGERYTSMSKTFFVALFYAALYPSGMFIAAFCFLYTYWVDKFLLLRVWKKPPQYDAQLADQARAQIMFSILVHMFVTANWYYGWPFDNTTKGPDGNYILVNKHTIDYTSSKTFMETWWRYVYVTPQPWHGTTQKYLVAVYGKASLVLLVGLTLFYFWKNVVDFLHGLFWGDYDEVGEDQNIPYEKVHNIEAYVPMCTPPTAELAGPLVAAVCTNLNPRHYPDLYQKKFKDQNVAEEFDATVQKKLFGQIKGYIAWKDIMDDLEGASEKTPLTKN